MKIGLEKEFFVKVNGECIVVPKTLPYDDSGLLTEARSLPFNNPEEAVFSLRASIYRIEQQAQSLNVQLSDNPVEKISRDVHLEASRKFKKGLTKYQNLYGFKHHKNTSKETPAGIHISFTKPQTVYVADAKTQPSYNSIFDFVSLFKFLDSQFAEEIKAAKRNPGFYEIKGDGRIEYRSLPANTSLDKIINVLKAANLSSY